MWFQRSNNYLILDENNIFLIDKFLESADYNHFHNLITKDTSYSHRDSLELFSDIESILISVNSVEDIEDNLVNKDINILNADKSYVSKIYNFNGTNIKINYQTTCEQDYIHPQFAHLTENNSNIIPDCEFHVITFDNHLYLFKNSSYLGDFKKRDYHLLQGKFAIELICALTNTKESDWLATFHASAIGNKSEAIMLIGESGKGKSTLATILMNHGFDLLTDDFTPMLAKSQQIHPYPSAISIKKNAFTLTDTIINPEEYKTFESPNSKKGTIRYINPNNLNIKPLPCSKILLVNYQKDSHSSLDNLDIKKVLEILIPDSWISPFPQHSKSFMNWLEDCTFYKLTYSDTNSAIALIETLLKP